MVVPPPSRGQAVALVIVCHRGTAPRLHRQPGLGAIERLDLAFLVDAEDHRMGRRIDVEANDILELVGEFGIVRNLERAHPMRLKSAKEFGLRKSARSIRYPGLNRRTGLAQPRYM